MKIFLTIFIGGVLCATVSLSSLQAMDQHDEALEGWGSVPQEIRPAILDEVVLNDEKVRALPCVCKEWNNHFNQPKWREITITPDDYNDTTMPEKLRNHPFVRSLTVEYDIRKFMPGCPVTDKFQTQNLLDFIHLIREGVCKTSGLTSFSMDEFPTHIFLRKFQVGSYTNEILLEDPDHSKRLTVKDNPPVELLQMLPFFKTLRYLKIEEFEGDNVKYFTQHVLDPELLPNLEEVWLRGKRDPRFNKKENEKKNAEK